MHEDAVSAKQQQKFHIEKMRFSFFNLIKKRGKEITKEE